MVGGMTMAEEKEELYELRDFDDGYLDCIESMSKERVKMRNLELSRVDSEWHWLPHTPPKTGENGNG